MFESDKLKVYEDDTMLSMEYKWFNPSAIFMIFFSVIWFAFLAFWYSMAAVGGAPWIFFVFPLLHVGVGLWLLYYSLCLLFNKTKIIVNYDLMNVIHYPIPWWKGNKKFPTEDFGQLYVKQKISKGKNNSERYTYTIRAKLKNGKDVEVASIGGLKSQDATRMEEYLEQYLGIEDIPVKGEYGRAKANSSTSQLPAPKAKARRSKLPGQMGVVYGLNTKSSIYFKEELVEVAHVTQYDWADGDSDKLLQLVSDEGMDTLVFLQKDKAVLRPYEEKMLDLYESNRLEFSYNYPPNTMEFGGREYLLSQKASGEAFLTGLAKPVELKQWLYQTKDKSAHLRIVVNKDMVTYYRGEKTLLSHFSKTLEKPLDLPKLDKEPLTDWEEEDLV
jgi:hypothetical protein